MSQDVKVVELVLPEGMKPVAPPAAVASGSWWIPAIVGVVVVGNAVLVWWRVKGRDPLKTAFEGVAARLGLNRAERRRIRELSTGRVAPVAILVSESALEKAGGDDPLMVSVRRKVKDAAL